MFLSVRLYDQIKPLICAHTTRPEPPSPKKKKNITQIVSPPNREHLHAMFEDFSLYHTQHFYLNFWIYLSSSGGNGFSETSSITWWTTCVGGSQTLILHSAGQVRTSHLCVSVICFSNACNAHFPVSAPQLSELWVKPVQLETDAWGPYQRL